MDNNAHAAFNGFAIIIFEHPALYVIEILRLKGVS